MAPTRRRPRRGAARESVRDVARILARVDPPLHPPRLVDGLVDRTALLAEVEQPSTRVAIVSAPAGYGKTTLLAQWAAASARPVNWVSITEPDNDAPVLLADLLLALESTATVLPSHYETIPLSAAGLSAVVLPRFGALVADLPPSVWMFDDVHVLRSDRGGQVLRVLVDHLAEGSVVVLSGRHLPDLPVARWRAGRAVVELGVDDLSLSDDEALELLRGADAGLGPATAALLVSRTEGWPAGLYLGTLALRDRVVGVDVPPTDLDDRAISEYLFDEVLRASSDDEADFLMRSAVLEHVTPELCDAVLERSDSSALLDRLERSNRFVRAVGPSRAAYRYHQLFRDLLRRELQRRDPTCEASLHGRASVWCEAQGDIDRAITHARDAGDVARVAELVFSAIPRYVGSGRDATVQRWIAALPVDVIAATPSLLVAAAWAAFTGGDVAETERWTSVLHGHPSDGRLPDGTTVGSATALLDALVSCDGLTRSLEDARRAVAGYEPTSPYRALACCIAGMAAHQLGDPTARELLEESRRLSVLLPPTAAQSCAELAALAAADGRWGDAVRLADEALEIVERFGFHERPAMCHAYAVVSLVHRARGARRRQGPRQAGRVAGRVPARRRPLRQHRHPRVARPGDGHPRGPRTRARAARGRAGAAHRLPRPRAPARTTGGGGAPARRGRAAARRRRRTSHARGAPGPPVPAHAPQLRRDRRRGLRVAQHGEDAGHRGVPQARCELAGRGGRPGPRGRAPRRLTGLSSRTGDVTRVEPRHAGVTEDRR